MITIEKIESGKYTQKELKNIMVNAGNNNRPDLKAAAEMEYNRVSMLDHMPARVRSEVKAIAEELMAVYVDKFKDNQIDWRVKEGGLMRSKEALADYYFSYKQENWRRSTYFAVVKRKENSEVEYHVRPHNADLEIFPADQQLAAVLLFNASLS